MNIAVVCIMFICDLIITAIAFYNTRHPPKGMESKNIFIRIFYPIVIKFIMFRLNNKKIIVRYKTLEYLKKVYTGKNDDELQIEYLCKRISIIMLVLISTFVIFQIMFFTNPHKDNLVNGYYIERSNPDESAKEINIKASYKGKEKDYKLKVKQRIYSKKELDKEFLSSLNYVKKTFLGNNKDLDHVSEKLNFISSIPNSPIIVSWQTDEKLINADGSINEIQENSVITYVTIVLSYMKTTQKTSVMLTIIKKENKNAIDELGEQIRQAVNGTSEAKWFSLPQSYNNQKIKYVENKTSDYIYVLFAAIILSVITPFLIDSKIKEQSEMRDKQLKQHYPEMLDKMILLLGAGMTVKGAWIRMTDEYENKRKVNKCSKNYVYEEMLITKYELENGESEANAYMKFGRRAALLSYLKFSTLLVQNLKKGSADILKLLDAQAEEAFKDRKEYAKVLGEEAGTKLLIPMIMMLMVVLIIIMFAAFQSI